MDAKRKQIALLAAAGLFLAIAGPAQQAHAQYGVGGNPTTAPSEEQLQKCDEYSIPRAQCTENAILAIERVKSAEKTQYGNDPEGSGTSLLATQAGQTWVFLGVLGAIFGGVAAAFFVRGKGTRTP
ncbi:MAG: hypothetical protein QXJ74_00815 [Nitrososphaera sp.]|uniref:hypothetical protein n=1 Tax=Nitrososphaera sp. TaxID=1971748 RepID=UPI001807FE50|nr:hypothetical protein [Nitrososphaera sp.]NWG37479.1 hypothetical protein [Nitrososphaera sp.]